jgi:hypothetical protein
MRLLPAYYMYTNSKILLFPNSTFLAVVLYGIPDKMKGDVNKVQ